MKNAKKLVLATTFLVMFLFLIGFAQGGKAEPKEIKFQKGTSSATIKDSIKGDQEAEYSFNARKGQLVSITISSTSTNNIVPVAKDPEFQDIKMDFDGKNKYSFELSQSGDIFLSFQGVKKSVKKTDFSFTISIKW